MASYRFGPFENAGRIGNAGVGIREGAEPIAVSAGLAKVFQIRERLRLPFESTFTNALNHTISRRRPPTSGARRRSVFFSRRKPLDRAAIEPGNWRSGRISNEWLPNPVAVRREPAT